MKRIALIFVATAVFAVPMFAGSAVKINNKSQWEIHHLYVAPASSNQWGPDQLGDQTIDTGGSFTLNEIPCNKYDVKVTDEDGDECVIENANLCADQSYWDITDEELLSCEND